MRQFVLRRLVQAVPTLLGIMLLTFLLTRLSPGDPVNLMVPHSSDLTEEDRAGLRAALGLTDPLPLQFVTWARQVVVLDFGKSFLYHRPAIELIGERIPNSMQPVLAGLAVALLIGVPLGVIAALTRGSRADHGIRVFSVVLNSTPDFFLGILFVLILGVQLRWFPIGSMNTVGIDCTLCWDRLYHMIGPTLLYANAGLAAYPRILRTEVLEILGQDYVRTARAKGLRERFVVVRHVVRNALIPVVSVLGGILTLVLGGSVIIEQIFTWPGLGRLLYESAINKDFPVVQASVVVGSALLIASYILRDIAYAWVDPRIRHR